MEFSVLLLGFVVAYYINDFLFWRRKRKFHEWEQENLNKFWKHEVPKILEFQRKLVLQNFYKKTVFSGLVKNTNEEGVR
jgi:hypothetical protein